MAFALRLFAAILVAIFEATFVAAQSCWGGDMTEEACCNLGLGPRGNEACWDATYNYEVCCPQVDSNAPGAASDVVASLAIEPGTVPNLPLHGGGHMPIAGVGLCCRPSASGEAVRQAVVDYLVMGGRHLDTAMLYGNHHYVGKGVRQAIELGVPRKDIFLTSKIWRDDYGFESATAWMDRTLEQLGLDYVDLVLLHTPACPHEQLPCGDPKQCRQETWLALQNAQRRGQVKHLGVSNFGPRQMEDILSLNGSPITANQFEYHPWVPDVHRRTAEWCHDHGIAVTAYGSMGSNGLAGQMLSQEALVQIGQQYGKSAGQVLLRWAIQKNVSVIPGTSNPKHMHENLNLFDFQLSDGDLQMLDNIPEDQRMLHFGHTPDAQA